METGHSIVVRRRNFLFVRTALEEVKLKLSISRGASKKLFIRTDGS